MERRRRLGDLLARPAGELLPHRLDDLPLARHHLQGLGDVLAEFDQLAAATRAGRWRWHDHALTRQVRRQRAPHRLLAGQAVHRRRGRLGRPSGDLVFGGAGFQLLELQFQLVEQLAAALGRLPKPLALHLGDQQLEIGHHRLGAGSASLRLLPCHALGNQCRLQRGDVVGQCFGRRHEPDYPILSGPGLLSTTG